MSVNDLLKLANEFESSTEEVPSTQRAPITEEFKSKPVPSSHSRKKEEVYESTMDYSQIIHTVRDYTKDNFLNPTDKLGPIKPIDYAGLYFQIQSQIPAQSEALYRKIQSFFSQLYPTDANNTTSGERWVEMLYPEEETKVTFRHFNNEIMFKITTID